MNWIDTHCHLDAPEFAHDAAAVRQRAAAAGVRTCVWAAVEPAGFERLRHMACAQGDAYCLGLHPLYVAQAGDDALAQVAQALSLHRQDPHLVAVGEIGLDYFVPALCAEPLRSRQEYFYREQLRLAREHNLPVVLHVRRSADRLLKHLRALDRTAGSWRGIAHAFNGSVQQAQGFVELGFKLGFGGALTFDSARQLRRLVQTLPLEALVLETDAPDMPPQWLYVKAQDRAAGQPQARNEPAELPRIAQVVAQLRGMELHDLAQAITRNALAALPRLGELVKARMGMDAGTDMRRRTDMRRQ